MRIPPSASTLTLKAALLVIACGASLTSLQLPAQAPPPSSTASWRLRQIAVISMSGLPEFDQAAFANGSVVISHPGAHTVDVFNPLKRLLVKHVAGVDDPRGIAVDDATKTVFIADAAKPSVAIISTANWTVLRTIPLPETPQDVVFAEKENALYISALTASSIMYVPLDQGQAATIDVGGRIDGIAYDAQAGRIFASVNNLAEVAVLQAAGAQTKVSQRWTLNASQPAGLAFDPQEGRLFVAVRYAVLSLNAGTGQEISRVPTAAGTDTLRYDPARQVLYAASSDGSITTIAADKGKLISQYELRTGVKGHNLALDPENHLLYLPGGAAGKSKLVVLKPFSIIPEGQSGHEDDDTPPAKTPPKP
ncbi:MAG: YncE family protein [Acidobacteriaceae bacterium]